MAIAYAVTGLTILAAQAASAVTFTDIVPDPQTGVQYERVPSANNELREMLIQQPIIFNPLDESTHINVARIPQTSRGWPGVAILDFDRDGDLDIYATNGPGADNSLFRNMLIETGEVRFEDVASTRGVAATDQDSSGVCFGDIDNDGDDDLMVLGWSVPNRMFENQGGSFVEITGQAGIAGGYLNSSSCSFGDIDNDGLLDVVVGNALPMQENNFGGWFVPFDMNQHTQVFKNIGGNRFADVSETSGVQYQAGFPLGNEMSAGITWAISLVDYDQDGDVDIITADDQLAMFNERFGGLDRGFIHVLKNDGAGFFTDVTVSEAGTNKTAAWMGLSFGDVNCDGHMDMFASNAGDYIFPFVRRNDFLLPYDIGEYASRWFLGTESGAFEDPGVGDLIATPFSWGTSMKDFDNDGDTDIMSYGGIDAISIATADNPGVIFENQGCSANFTYNPNTIPKDHSRRSVHGSATGDLNNDGFIDLVSVSSFDRPADTPLIPLGISYGGPFDSVANMVPQFVPTGVPNEFTTSGIDFPNGTIAIELNSADNNNRWVEATAQGSVGIVNGATVNRSGIGAVMTFTPNHGKTSMQPVLGGSSHLSQDSLAQGFGLGSARRGTLDILWPGGVRNRLYDVRAGERITMPEIPCSYDGDWSSPGQYIRCVNDALDELHQAGTLNRQQARRFRLSALYAYFSNQRS
ncbi:MAG: hypothetical protein Tsb002_26780 [Wenzhouxiangellaceae bacterium]